ncbi:MAG: glycosyltransferase family 9 protein [Verrucomicrobiales bacterium]
MPRDRGKMLVIRGGAIGDFILTLPALAALRETFEETHIELLGYPAMAELAREAGMIEECRSIESGQLARFFGRNTKLDEGWAEYFASFNLILSYLYDPDQIFQTNVGRASKAQFIAGPHRPNENENIHATDVFLKPLEKLAIFGFDPAPRIILPGGRKTKEPGAPFRLAIHPGSGSARKNWPESSWGMFLNLLVDNTDWQLTLVGGEAESEVLENLAKVVPADRTTIAKGQSLLETARLLAGHNYFVGHDSGITHLAGALGTPLLALWGPSKFDIWRPLGPKTDFIHAGTQLAQLPAEEVFLKLRGLVEQTA